MKEGYDNAAKFDRKALSNFEVQDYNVNKFANLCMRLLNKGAYKEFKKSSMIFNIVTNLENIGDEIVRLSLDMKSKPTQNTLEIYSDTIKSFGLFYEIFYKFFSS